MDVNESKSWTELNEGNKEIVEQAVSEAAQYLSGSRDYWWSDSGQKPSSGMWEVLLRLRTKKIFGYSATFTTLLVPFIEGLRSKGIDVPVEICDFLWSEYFFPTLWGEFVIRNNIPEMETEALTEASRAVSIMREASGYEAVTPWINGSYAKTLLPSFSNNRYNYRYNYNRSVNRNYPVSKGAERRERPLFLSWLRTLLGAELFDTFTGAILAQSSYTSDLTGYDSGDGYYYSEANAEPFLDFMQQAVRNGFSLFDRGFVKNLERDKWIYPSRFMKTSNPCPLNLIVPWFIDAPKEVIDKEMGRLLKAADKGSERPVNFNAFQIAGFTALQCLNFKNTKGMKSWLSSAAKDGRVLAEQGELWEMLKKVIERDWKDVPEGGVFNGKVSGIKGKTVIYNKSDYRADAPAGDFPGDSAAYKRTYIYNTSFFGSTLERTKDFDAGTRDVRYNKKKDEVWVLSRATETEGNGRKVSVIKRFSANAYLNGSTTAPDKGRVFLHYDVESPDKCFAINDAMWE